MFRFYCEEEEEDGVVYESGEWLPGESVATHYVPAVTHDCKGPDRVISGVHVLTSPYIRYWSFYCSRVGGIGLLVLMIVQIPHSLLEVVLTSVWVWHL